MSYSTSWTNIELKISGTSIKQIAMCLFLVCFVLQSELHSEHKSKDYI